MMTRFIKNSDQSKLQCMTKNKIGPHKLGPRHSCDKIKDTFLIFQDLLMINVYLLLLKKCISHTHRPIE